MTKTLFVVRHAKAEGHAFRDVDRVLAGRGRRDSTRLGEWFATQSLTTPVRAYVSRAARTQETWDRVSAGLETPVEIDVRKEMYGAGTDEIREIVADTPDHVSSVILVGHNPTMAGVVWELSGERTRAAAAFQARGFPTAACAVLALGTWEASSGSMRTFVTPTDY